MKDILSIFEFNLPFISKKNEYLKYLTIIDDIKKLFIYEELYLKLDKQKIENTEITKIYLKQGLINIYYNGNYNYHLPTFFLEYKGKDIPNDDLLKNFLDIFYSIDSINYIFDFYIDNENIINYNKLTTLKDLKKSFNNYSYEELRNFLNNSSKEYLDENIRQNIIIRNSILYMIYICFNIYRSFIKANETIIEIDKSSSLIDNYFSEGQFKLFKKRIKIIEKSSFIIFNKYNILLETFFKIISDYKK